MSPNYLEYETISERINLIALEFMGQKKIRIGWRLKDNDSLLEFHLCKMFIDQAADFFYLGVKWSEVEITPYKAINTASMKMASSQEHGWNFSSQ